MDIREITNELEKIDISRYILEALPEWFSIPESREEYIRSSQGKKFFCAFIEENPVGFLYLKQKTPRLIHNSRVYYFLHF